MRLQRYWRNRVEHAGRIRMIFGWVLGSFGPPDGLVGERRKSRDPESESHYHSVISFTHWKFQSGIQNLKKHPRVTGKVLVARPKCWYCYTCPALGMQASCMTLVWVCRVGSRMSRTSELMQWLYLTVYHFFSNLRYKYNVPMPVVLGVQILHRIPYLASHSLFQWTVSILFTKYFVSHTNINSFSHYHVTQFNFLKDNLDRKRTMAFIPVTAIRLGVQFKLGS